MAECIMAEQKTRGEPFSVEEVFKKLPEGTDLGFEHTHSVVRAVFSNFIRITTRARITQITPRWYFESLEATQNIFLNAQRLRGKKITVVTADKDSVVDSRQIMEICERLGAKPVALKECYHMAFEEQDQARDQLLAEVAAAYQREQ